VAAVAASAVCVSCSLTMVLCEVGELNFVSKFDFMKGFPLVPIYAKAPSTEVLNSNKKVNTVM
jgi:hypothetical protein